VVYCYGFFRSENKSNVKMAVDANGEKQGRMWPTTDVNELVRCAPLRLTFDMRNSIVFIFWYVVNFFLIGALAGFWVHLDSSTLTDSELGQRIGHLLGFWALGLPWFATFFGWHFGWLPFFKRNEDEHDSAPSNES